MRSGRVTPTTTTRALASETERGAGAKTAGSSVAKKSTSRQSRHSIVSACSFPGSQVRRRIRSRRTHRGRESFPESPSKPVEAAVTVRRAGAPVSDDEAHSAPASRACGGLRDRLRRSVLPGNLRRCVYRTVSRASRSSSSQKSRRFPRNAEITRFPTDALTSSTPPPPSRARNSRVIRLLDRPLGSERLEEGREHER